MRDLNSLGAVIETWQAKKYVIIKDFTPADMRNFVEVSNFHAKQLIAHMEKQDPDFFESLAELATIARTLVTPGAKTFADGVDRTNL